MSEGTYREAVPLHFLFKIDSFSLLAKNSIVKYESNVFQTGGYKWKLSLYPTGNTNDTIYAPGHISLYLELGDTSLPDCWEFTVSFKLFLYDNIRHRYFFHGTNTFHEMKKVWGFPQFLSFQKFNDPTYGFLVNDSCVFGAEVFVSIPPEDIERLSMFKQTATAVKHIWKIEKFSNMTEECLHSEKFKAGDYIWDILMYPQGNSEGKNNSVSLYLHFSDFEKNPGLKVCANFKLCIRNQCYGSNVEFSTASWFCASSKNLGWHKFIGLSQMKNFRYLVKDTCIVEAEVTVLGIVSKRP